MPETINWSFVVEALQGPRISGSGVLEVDAYDKLSVVLAAGDTEVDVQVQPAEAEGKVHLLVIRASAYDADITFSADAGATDFPLHGPVLLIGTGAVRLLSSAPQTLRFSNRTGADVTTDIMVARDSVP